MVKCIRSKFQTLVKKGEVNYKESKSNPIINSIRHGLRLLERKHYLEELSSLVIKEKSKSDIDNDDFVDGFDDFLSIIDNEGICTIIEKNIKLLKKFIYDIGKSYKKGSKDIDIIVEDIIRYLEWYNLSYDGCIEIPSGFTPNNDGTHDEWAIYGLYNFPDVVVSIHNRWGQRIFFSEGYTVPWDGKNGGVDLPIAAYYYVIELKDSGKVFNGIVTIKR